MGRLQGFTIKLRFHQQPACNCHAETGNCINLFTGVTADLWEVATLLLMFAPYIVLVYESGE